MAEPRQILTYQKLVVPMSMRSVYWKCYGFPASADGIILTKEKIVCLLCKNVIVYNRNTSNLRMHLQNRHADQLAQLEMNAPPRKPKDPNAPKEKRLNKKTKRMGNALTTDAVGTVVVGSEIDLNNSSMTVSCVEEFEGTVHLGGSGSSQQPQQVKLMYSKGSNNDGGGAPGKPHVSLMCSEEENQNLTIESLHPFVIPIDSKSVCDAIAEFVVMDMQLPDVVEGRGFQRLIATLKSPCEIPSKAKLVDEVIPRVYDTMKDSAQDVIQSLKTYMSLTIEEWDSAAGDTYITFSVCYLHEKEESLQSKVLSTIHCPTTSDTSYWVVVFENLLEEWSIHLDRVKAVVCGSCRPEVINAILTKGLNVVPCLVQTLQEVCTRVCFEQDDVREILNKCRTFIYLVYKNNNALASLRIQDHLMSLEESPLSSDFPRVWISTYLMMESLLARRQVYSSILDNVDANTYDKELVTLSDQDWTLMEDVIAVLEPFKVTIMTLSEERSPLVSLLKPLLWQLTSCHLKPKADDSLNVQVFKAALKTLITEKYSEPTVSQLLQIATTLDPRFRNLPNTAEESRAALEGPVKEALIDLIDRTPEEPKPLAQEEQPDKKKPRLSGMFMLLGEVSSPSNNSLSTQDRASLELVQYQSEPCASLDQCPVAWWSRASSKCPNLSRLASQYTCVPATAIPPARIPIDAQISYEIKRSNLSPEIVDRLIFLNSNHSL